MSKEMTVVDKLQRTFNNLPQEKKDRINRILENYEETVFSTPHEPNNEDRLEQEITTLREQVEKLTEECVVLRASSRSKLETIANLEWQVEKLTKERETRLDLAEQNKQLKAELKSIDDALNDPRANLTLTTSEIIWELKAQVEKLTKERDALKTVPMKYRRMQFNAEMQEEVTQLQEQLAALAEQNEKLRKVLLRLACLGNGDQYGNSIGNCIAQEALSLPDLTTPVLNRIRAEGMRMAGDFVESPIGRKLESLNDGPRQLAEGIRARAGDLEKNDAL